MLIIFKVYFGDFFLQREPSVKDSDKNDKAETSGVNETQTGRSQHGFSSVEKRKLENENRHLKHEVLTILGINKTRICELSKIVN